MTSTVQRITLLAGIVLLATLAAISCQSSMADDSKVGSYFSTPPGFSLAGQAKGSVPYFDGDAWAPLPIGTSGNLLKAGATIPAWSAATGGVSIGLVSARPSAVGLGLIYMPTDLPVTYVDDPNGATWRQFVHGIGYTIAPGSGVSYTTVGNVFVNHAGDALRAMSADNLANAALLSGSLGVGSTWVVTLIAKYAPNGNVSYPEIGVLVADGNSASSNGYAFSKYWAGSTPGRHNDTVLIGTTTRSSTGTEVAGVYFGAQDVCMLRGLADGTQLHWQESADNVHWFDWAAVSTPASLTWYGFLIGAGNGPVSGVGQAIILQNTSSALTVAQATVTGATNATPIVITTSAPHGMLSGDRVQVRGVGGNTNANVIATINVLTSTTFQMVTIAGNAGYTSGGTVTLLSR